VGNSAGCGRSPSVAVRQATRSVSSRFLRRGAQRGARDDIGATPSRPDRRFAWRPDITRPGAGYPVENTASAGGIATAGRPVAPRAPRRRATTRLWHEAAWSCQWINRESARTRLAAARGSGFPPAWRWPVFSRSGNPRQAFVPPPRFARSRVARRYPSNQGSRIVG